MRIMDEMQYTMTMAAMVTIQIRNHGFVIALIVMIMTATGNKNPKIAFMGLLARAMVMLVRYDFVHVRFASLMHLVLVRGQRDRLQADQKDHEVESEFSIHPCTLASKRAKIKWLPVLPVLLHQKVWLF